MIVCFQKDQISKNNLKFLTKGQNFRLVQIGNNYGQIFHVDILMTSVFDRVENIVRKEENSDYQDFLLFPQYCFHNIVNSGLFKIGIVW